MARPGTLRWSGRSGPAARLAVALALLLAIGSDLAADSRCHAGPPPSAPAGTALQASSREACDETCVPDCYCCSTPSVGLASVLPEPSGLAEPVAVAVEADCPPGVHPLLYRPPLVLS